MFSQLMGSMEKAVHYCCVAKGSRILQAYSGGDIKMEKLAPLCLERVPLYHKWYSETVDNKTYSFLMEDGFVYFAVVDLSHVGGNPGLIRFLEHVRNEFKKMSKRVSKGSLSSSNHNTSLQEEHQLVPVIRQLIASLQHASRASNVDGNGNGNESGASTCPCDVYREVEVATSSKAPLLGKAIGKQEKKAKDDHRISIRVGSEMEENRKSTEQRGSRVEQGTTVSPNPLEKDMSTSMRMRSASQSPRRKWCCLVRLVLAIDAGICITLLLIWLLICQGLQCIR